MLPAPATRCSDPVCPGLTLLAPPEQARARKGARSEIPPRDATTAALSSTAALTESRPDEPPRWVTDSDCDLGLSPDTPRACSYGHISPGGVLRWSGQVISLLGQIGGPKQRQNTKRPRGAITEWSQRSRGRLVLTVLASDAATWGQPEDSTIVLFVTLTYPGQDGREFIPSDGRKAHRQQRRFLEAWTQQFGACRTVWKLEFQARAGDWANDWERCAPHWCCWVEAPANTPISTVRDWVSTTWWRIVGSGARAHLVAGTRVEYWRGSFVGYALKYMRKGRDKEYQHRVPEGFTHVGRWWGLVGLRVRWIEIPLSAREFFALRRLMIRSRNTVRRRKSRLRVRGRYAGLWMWTRRNGKARTRQLVDEFMRGTQLALTFLKDSPSPTLSLPSAFVSGGADTSGGEAPQVSHADTEPTGIVTRQHVACVPVPSAEGA
jgi:hypothetical protein